MTTVTNADALEVNGLTVAYGSRSPAVRDVSLRVPTGSVVALLGANGAGKTTTIRAITGLIGLTGGRAISGSVSLHGRDLGTMDCRQRVRRGLAQVLEGRHVFANLTVDDNLRAGAITRTDRRALKRDLEEIYGRFPDLTERRQTKAGLLSGGQQQMLVIGRALLTQPSVLMLDEPSLGLAPIIVHQVGDIIRQIRTAGTSVLLVEQDVSLAFALADYVYVLDSGQIIIEGRSDELQGDPRIQAAYLGGREASPNGLLDGRIAEAGAAHMDADSG
jgi:branched-chain amino acid transport system ATP-binding protein